jgi:hypothetical protein
MRGDKERGDKARGDGREAKWQGATRRARNQKLFKPETLQTLFNPFQNSTNQFLISLITTDIMLGCTL